MRSCLICGLDLHQDPHDDKPYVGPVLRLTTGVLEHRKWGDHLVKHTFEDEELEKWMHGSCARDEGIVVIQMKHEHCILCGNRFELEGDGCPGDMVIRFERGHIALEAWEEEDDLVTKTSGFVHFTCAVFDEWGLPLTNMKAS